MTYRTDEHPESSLIDPKPLTDDKRTFRRMILTQLKRVGSWRVFAPLLDKFSNRMQGNTSGYHNPLLERWTLLVTVDAVCVVSAIWGSSLFWHLEPADSQKIWNWLPIILASWWVLAYFNDLYDIPSSCDRLTTTLRIVGSGLLGLAIYSVINLRLSNPLPSRFLLYFLASALPLLIVWRLAYARLSRFLFPPHRILLIGLDDGQSIVPLLRPAG